MAKKIRFCYSAQNGSQFFEAARVVRELKRFEAAIIVRELKTFEAARTEKTHEIRKTHEIQRNLRELD